MLDLQIDVEDVYASQDSDAEGAADWASLKREAVVSKSWPETLGRLAALISDATGKRLFDVGAAEGSFLAAARDAGFVPDGNEISSGTIELAQRDYGIVLQKGDLSGLTDVGPYDVVTMWCVLAHVPDSDSLLREASRILRPGGVLFMQTPRWTSMDSVALAALEASGGRISRVTDRRLPGHHLRFHTEHSISAQLRRLGYEVISIERRARYSLSTESYVASLGVGPTATKLLSRPVDALLARELFFRIVLDVYARKVK